MNNKSNDKLGKFLFYFSILISLLIIYFCTKNGNIKENLNNGNWFNTLGLILVNILNIYGGIKSKNDNMDVIFNTYRIKGCMFMLTSIIIFDFIPRLYFTLV